MPLMLRCVSVLEMLKCGGKCFKINEIWYMFHRKIPQVAKSINDEPEEGFE